MQAADRAPAQASGSPGVWGASLGAYISPYISGAVDYVRGKSKAPEELAAQMKDKLVDEQDRWRRGCLAERKALQELDTWIQEYMQGEVRLCARF